MKTLPSTLYHDLKAFLLSAGIRPVDKSYFFGARAFQSVVRFPVLLPEIFACDRFSYAYSFGGTPIVRSPENHLPTHIHFYNRIIHETDMTLQVVLLLYFQGFIR